VDTCFHTSWPDRRIVTKKPPFPYIRGTKTEERQKGLENIGNEKREKNAKKKRAEMNMGRPGGQGLLIFGPWPHNRGRGGRTGERLENSRRGWGRKLKKEGKKKERQGGERKKEKKRKEKKRKKKKKVYWGGAVAI